MTEPDLAETLAPATTRPVPPLNFTVEDIVRQGSRVRRRRRVMAGTAGIATVAVTAALVAWHPRLPSSSSPASPGPSATKAEAVAELTYLFTVLPLPAGSAAVSPDGAVPAVPDAPVGHLVHLTRWYSVALSPNNVGHSLMDHSWSGSFSASSGSVSPDGVEVLYGQGKQAHTAAPLPVVGFSIRPRGNASIVRVDGWVAERAYLQRPTDTLLPAGLDTVSVEQGEYDNGAPYRSTLSLDLTGRRVQALVAALNARPATVDNLECAANHPERLTFRTGAHTIVLTYLPWCSSLRVTVDGAHRPALGAFDTTLQQAIAALVPTITS